MAVSRIKIPYERLGRLLGGDATATRIEDLVEGNQDWLSAQGDAAVADHDDPDGDDADATRMEAMSAAEGQLNTAVVDALYAAFERAGETLHFNVTDDAKLRCFFLTPTKDWKDTATQWVELLIGAGDFEPEFGRKSPVAQWLAQTAASTPMQAVEKYLSALGDFDAVYGGLDRAYQSSLKATLRAL